MSYQRDLSPRPPFLVGKGEQGFPKNLAPMVAFIVMGKKLHLNYFKKIKQR